MSTKAKITKKALELFNQNGIEYVGMRELAASLDMQIGNITYYYPTKNDLVNQLALDLSALNTHTLASSANLTLLSFLEMRVNTFRNQQEYRCLFLSFVHLMKQNPVIAERYKAVEGERRDNLRDHIITLQKEGYLVVKSSEEVTFLASAIGLIARFWISDTAIAYPFIPAEDQAHHYVKLIAQLLVPYATETGNKQINDFLNNK